MASKKHNKYNKTETESDTENKQVVARGEGGRGGKKIGKEDLEVQTSSCKVSESQV